MVWFATLIRWIVQPPEELKQKLLASYQATFRPVIGMIVKDIKAGWEVLLLEIQRQLREQKYNLRQGYIITIDGWWFAHPGRSIRELTEPSYRLWYRIGTVWDSRVLALRADLTTHSRYQGCVKWAMPDGESLPIIECFEDLGTSEEFKKRLECLQYDLKNEPHDPELINIVGDYQLLTGNVSEAMSTYRHRITLGSAIEGQWYARVQLAKLQSESRASQGNLRAAMEMISDRAEVYYYWSVLTNDTVKNKQKMLQKALRCNYHNHTYRVERQCYTYAALNQLSLISGGKWPAYFDEQLLRRFDVPTKLWINVNNRQAKRGVQLSPSVKWERPVHPRVPNYHATLPSLSRLSDDKYLASVELVNFIFEGGQRYVFDLDRQPRVIIQFTVVDTNRRQSELPLLHTPTNDGEVFRQWQVEYNGGNIRAVAMNKTSLFYFQLANDQWNIIGSVELAPHHGYSIIDDRKDLTLLMEYHPLSLIQWIPGDGEYRIVKWSVESRLHIPELIPTGGVRYVELPKTDAKSWWSSVRYLSFAYNQVDGSVVHRMVYHDINLVPIAISAPFSLTGHPAELIGGWSVVYSHLHILISIQDRVVVWRIYTLREFLNLPTVHYSAI